MLVEVPLVGQPHPEYGPARRGAGQARLGDGQVGSEPAWGMRDKKCIKTKGNGVVHRTLPNTAYSILKWIHGVTQPSDWWEYFVVFFKS